MRLRSGLAPGGVRRYLSGMRRYLLYELTAKVVAPFVVRHRANWFLRPLLARVRRFPLLVWQVTNLTFGDLPAAALPMELWLFLTDNPRPPDLGWGDRCQELHLGRRGTFDNAVAANR